MNNRRARFAQASLFISLVFPAVSFVQGFLGSLITFALLVLANGFSFSRRAVLVISLVVALFSGITYLHFIQSGSFSEFYDLVRLLPLIAAVIAVKNISFRQVFRVLYVVAWINVLIVFMVEFDIFRSFFEGFNARTLEESYGRHSGLFVNVSTLGCFSLLLCTFAVWGFLYGENLRSSALYFLLGGFLLLASGGKSQLLALLLIMFLGSFYARRDVFKYYLIAVLLLILVLFGHIYNLFYLRQIDKIFALFSNGFSGVSSVLARFEIWLEFFDVWVSDLSYSLIGVPLLFLDRISGTYDSDWIWVLFRFGFLVFFAYFLLMFLGLLRSVTNIRYPFLPLAAVVFSSVSVGVWLSFQLSFLVWFIIFSAVSRSEYNAVNIR